MNKKLSSLCLASLIGLTSLCAPANDDKSMTPPPPVKNTTMDAVVGNWEGEGDMDGMKMHDNVKFRWILNHHYITMELRSQRVDNPKLVYEGLGIFAVDNSGNIKLWWFDSWGGDAISTGAGTASNNKIKFHDGNQMLQEARTFTIKGNTMDMAAKGKMNMNGKEIPFNHVGTYHKK